MSNFTVKVEKSSIKFYSLFLLFVFCFGLAPLSLNLVVDPYGLFSKEKRTGKIGQFIERAHYPLWKLASYREGNSDIFILGDSRARALQEKYWNEFGQYRVSNLAYGGGTIPEIYDTFQILKNDPGLRTLVIGIQLRSFDEDHKKGMNRVPEAQRLVRHPLEYLKNWSVTKTSFHIFKSANTFINQAYSATRNLPKKFAMQVKQNGRADWQSFEFSHTYWEMLAEIGAWAKAHNKKLVFVIPPTITEMQQTIAAAGLLKQNADLRSSLSHLGLVLDFDMQGELTHNLKNFNDAYHFTPQVGRMIVGEILRAIGSEKAILQKVQTRQKSILCPLKTHLKGLHEGRNCQVTRGGQYAD